MRQAIEAAKIATVRQRYAEIADGTVVGIFENAGHQVFELMIQVGFSEQQPVRLERVPVSRSSSLR